MDRLFIYALVFLLPLFALPISLDPLEVNKQTLLVLLSLGAFLVWVGRMAIKRKFVLRMGWINAVPLCILAATVASAANSSSPYISWIGGSEQEYLSVLTVFSLTLLYYVVVNRVETDREHRVVHALLLWSAAIAGVVGIASMFGGSLFNTVGTFNALGVYLAAMSTFGCGLLVASRPDHSLVNKGWLGGCERALAVVVSLEALFVLLALDYAVLWGVWIAGLALLFGFALVRAKEIHDARRFLFPCLLMVTAILYFLWLPSPMRVALPLEVTPSYGASADIARQVLESDRGLLGSGPGTFAFDYALLHDASVNGTQLWAQRFDRAASFAHTLAPGIGIVGLIAWGAFFLVFFFRGSFRVVAAKDYRDWAAVLVDLAGWSVLAFAAFFYSGNMTSVFLLYLFAALLSSQLVPRAANGSFDAAPRIGFFFTALTILCSIGVLTTMFVGAGRYLSEAALAKAVRSSEGGDGSAEIVAHLERAVRYNRFNDTAERNLSQALVMRTGDVLADLDNLQEVAAETRSYVLSLSSASIKAATRATDLSPRDAANWLSRGSVYREFIPLIGNAGGFAVEAYERAAELEPLNPANQTELGKTYLVLAESWRERTGSEDPAVAEAATIEINAYLAKAERAFDAAVALKADYAPAHYQLAVTYERQGRLDDAIGKMESVKKYNLYDVGVAFQIGLLYLRRAEPGDVERAEVEFERAVELVPTYANARWFLATIYEQQGNAAGAIEQIEKVLEYNPDNGVVRARLERLRNGERTSEIPTALDESAP